MRIGYTLAPAPKGRRSDLGSSERAFKFDAGIGGKSLKLDDFGGANADLFHVRSMCTRAQLSTTKSCTDGTGVHNSSRAYVHVMARTASERDEHYRQKIAQYVADVLKATGWSQSEAGRRIGRSHSTISRALAAKFETEYPTLLALAKASGIPLPNELSDAAAEIRTPIRPPPTTDTVDAYVDELFSADAEVQRAFFERWAKRTAP